MFAEAEGVRVRRLAIKLGFLAFALSIGLWLGYYVTAPRAGVGVSREQAGISKLPADARNVSYYFLPPVAYYEFDTSEAGFEEWAGRWGLDWKDRREGAISSIIWNHAAGRPGEVWIADGVKYGWWEGDAVWSLNYDRRAGRAYCSGHYR